MENGKLGVDVRLERIVEEIRHEAEGELCDEVDNLSIRVTGGAHGCKICSLNMATGFCNFLCELHGSIGFGVRRMSLAMKIHIVLLKAAQLATQIGMG